MGRVALWIVFWPLGWFRSSQHHQKQVAEAQYKALKKAAKKQEKQHEKDMDRIVHALTEQQ